MNGAGNLKGRETISAIFLSVVVGVALQEAMEQIQISLAKSPALPDKTIALFLIFILNGMRFFIGNILHMSSEAVSKISGRLWLLDLAVITLEMIIIVFLGRFVSVQESGYALKYSAVFLFLLCILDISWISLIMVLNPFLNRSKRDRVPWKWGAVNFALLLAMIIFRYEFSSFESSYYLWFMVCVSVIAFFYDIIVADHYGLLSS